MIIYYARNKQNNKIYIGATTKTLKKRQSTHWFTRNNKNRRDYDFYQDLKNDRDSFEWSVIEEITGDYDELKEAERKWIFYYKNKGYNLYNKIKGGGGSLYGWTDERRKAISKRMTGNQFGLGLKFSKESRRRISEAKKDKRIFVFKNKHTGATFEGTPFELRIKYEVHQGNLSRVILGKRKSVKGWIIEKQSS